MEEELQNAVQVQQQILPSPLLLVKIHPKSARSTDSQQVTTKPMQVHPVQQRLDDGLGLARS